MTRKLGALILALILMMGCAMPAALAEPVISNEVTITPIPPTDPVDPGVVPGLKLDMVLVPLKVAPGGVVSGQITLKNTGDAVKDLPVVCQLPRGATPVDVDLFTYRVAAPEQLTWTVSLEKGQMATMTFDALLPETAREGTQFVFTTTCAQMTASGVATIAVSDLRVKITSNVKRAQAGDAVKYTVALGNLGTANEKALALRSYVPEGMSIDLNSLSPDAQYLDGVITWTLDLPAGARLERTFVGIMPDDAVQGDTFVNIAQAKDVTASSTVTAYEPEPELDIAMKVNNRTPGPGTTVKYTITVTNDGNADATDVKIIDSLPEDLDISTKHISDDGEYLSREDRIVWYVDVPADDKVVLTFRAYVPDWTEEGDTFVNRVRIKDGESAKATMVVTEDAVPKTGYDDKTETIVPAAWAAPAVEGGELVASADKIPDIEPLPVQEAFAQQVAERPELIGFLKASDILDLPVMQAGNNDFYMIHNADGKEDETGALFLDERNHLNPLDSHLLIYGHNMKSGAMFGNLANYREVQYVQAHPVFTFQSIYDAEPSTYAVVAVLDASMDPGNKDYLKIRRPNFDDEADMTAYVSTLLERSYLTIPVEIAPTDSLLSLVTCSYFQDNGRLIVIGRKLREGETVEQITQLMATATAK
ncbi:MAG: sortase [Clostridia bacterium]